jgi:exodeoxyribonuclease VII small subunit
MLSATAMSPPDAAMAAGPGANALKTKPADGDPADIAAMSFEDALAELERIVRGLEGGQQKLEEAITAYERGARLRQHCEAKLAEAETRVQAIVAGADGALALRASE